MDRSDISNYYVPGSPISQKLFLDFAKSLELKQMIKFPTSGNIYLDLLFTNVIEVSADIKKGPPFGASDHSSFTVELKIFRNNKENPYISSYRFNFRKANYNIMDKYFANINWNEFFRNTDDIDIAYNKFITILHEAMELFVPKLNNRKVRSSSFPKFISNTQKYLVKLARNLQYEKVRKKYNLIAKRLENQIKRNIRKRENKILKQSKSEYLRFIAAKSRPRLSYPVITSDSGVNFFTPIEKSTAFLNHFKSFYQNALEVKPIPTTCMDPLFDHGLIFMTDIMVYEDMKKLQPKINPSPDGIPQILLKKCATSLSKPVAYLLRLSFLQGKIPLYWKKSIIVPLYKGKNLDKSSPNSYRPVALTCPIAKMVERCIFTEMKAFLDHKKVIPPYQHGFRTHKSVISLLLEEMDDLTSSVESNKCADILFFDVSKAFDSVNLDLLIQKISNFGIGNSTIT